MTQVTVKNSLKHLNGNCLAVPQVRGKGLRSVLFAHEQVDANADVVLLGSSPFLSLEE